jgi:hypothetical protein
LDTVAVNAMPGQPDCVALLKLAVPVTLVELTNLPDSLIVAEPASVPLARCLALPLKENEPLADTLVRARQQDRAQTVVVDEALDPEHDTTDRDERGAALGHAG